MLQFSDHGRFDEKSYNKKTHPCFKVGPNISKVNVQTEAAKPNKLPVLIRSDLFLVQ